MSTLSEKAYRGYQAYCETLKRLQELDKKELIAYWTDRDHLQEKLQVVSERILQLALLPEDVIAKLEIESGTGSIVIPCADKQKHFLDLDNPGPGQLYISKAILPKDKEPLLRNLQSFIH